MENTTEDIKPESEAQTKPQETSPNDDEATNTMAEEGKPQTENAKSEEDLAVEGFGKLSDGKRNLACDEYSQAVDALAEACQLLSAKYGEEADELSESYYYYGRALLELARMENGVLGNALDGVSAEEENEAELSESEQFEKASKTEDCERDELRNQIYTAMSAEEKESQDNNKTSSEPAAASTESTADKDVKAGDETAKEPAKEKTETAEEKTEPAEEKTETVVENDKAEDKAGEEENEEGEEDAEENMEEEEATSSQDDEDNPDDVPNLQLSWEVLELAKKIYLRQVEKPDCDKAIKMKLSDVYRSLGEVSLETGSSEQAVLDMNACLALQKECLEADSRYIAETHYQLGNAYLLNKDYKLGVEQLRLAKSVLETRIEHLEAKLKDDSENSDKLTKELTDLKQLLPDILAKVEDAEDESKNAELTETKVKAALNASTTTIGFGDASDSGAASANGAPIEVKKANDISNLVRKRKPEEQSHGDTGEVKKVKSDVNASGDKENGHVDQPVPEVKSQ